MQMLDNSNTIPAIPRSRNNDNYGISEISDIESIEIQKEAIVVFDWDNTLKVITKERKISSSVKESYLEALVKNLGCRLFILSAIQPSRTNLETLLLEVDRVGLRKYFCPACQKAQAESQLACWECQHRPEIQVGSGSYKYVCWGNIVICGYDKAEVFQLLTKQLKGDNVVFFDDEKVNILNFHQLLEHSLCFLVHKIENVTV
ncbi:uncharacterized protein LOC131939542 [Physella acuta]|uniref:uncharacterized protein LOC131939542 n=1 Tax=Physella acuta TaxID=109671 RepID=UPI0027DE72E6|nr:uncharacterized protein LOC131939542 [Physella acuta]